VVHWLSLGRRGPASQGKGKTATGEGGEGRST